MNNKDYPALFQSADKASRQAQTKYIIINLSYIILIILGILCELLSFYYHMISIVSAFLFITALLCVFIMLVKKYENNRYAYRTLAESVKTATWRFIMCTEPFKKSYDFSEVKSRFRSVLRDIIRHNTFITNYINGTYSEKNQITEKMLNIRDLSFKERKKIYIDQRIENQIKKYSQQYTLNKQRILTGFIIVISCNILAVIFTLIKITIGSNQYLSINILVIIMAVSALTWIHFKKYQELASSNKLAAHEIEVIKGFSEEIKTEKDFSDFVINAEKAFSRKYTQWVVNKIK